MIPYFWSLILLLGLAVPQASLPVETADMLTSAERAQLARATKIDSRIKVYQTASERFRANLANEMTKRDYSAVPGTLGLWTQLLKISLEDIDSSITNRKKRSGALKNFEIRLRKSIGDAKEYRTAVPVDVIDRFDAWLVQAEDVRQKFIDILFPK